MIEEYKLHLEYILPFCEADIRTSDIDLLKKIKEAIDEILLKEVNK